MTQKIRSQASRFWSVLVSADTLNAYKHAIDVTLQILKEGILLIWLVLCLVLVIFDWGSAKSIAAGRGVRNWYGNLEKTDSTQIASDAKQKLLSASKASVTMTVAQARQQLGLPEKEVASEPPTSNPKTTSSAPSSKTNPPAVSPVTSNSEDAATDE